jgi:N-acyl-L-homoserine lactone synthetase
MPAPSGDDIWELSRFAVSKQQKSSFGFSMVSLQMMLHAVLFAREQCAAASDRDHASDGTHPEVRRIAAAALGLDTAWRVRSHWSSIRIAQWKPL